MESGLFLIDPMLVKIGCGLLLGYVIAVMLPTLPQHIVGIMSDKGRAKYVTYGLVLALVYLVMGFFLAPYLPT
jgi:hypothetical protein